jgi:hypothetical protein
MTANVGYNSFGIIEGVFSYLSAKLLSRVLGVIFLAGLTVLYPSFALQVSLNAFLVIDGVSCFTAHLAHFPDRLLPTLIECGCDCSEGTIACDSIFGICVKIMEGACFGVLGLSVHIAFSFLLMGTYVPYVHYNYIIK